MDRDIAIQIVTKLTAINTALQLIDTGTATSSDNRSASPAPEENQRSAPAEDPEEEPEAPEEPETRTNK